MTAAASTAPSLDPIPTSSPRRWTPWVLGLVGALVLLLVPVVLWSRAARDPAMDEALEWLKEYQAVRSRNISQRLPARPLSLAGQQALVDLLVRPESRFVEFVDSVWRRLPPTLRQWVPRFPPGRGRIMLVGSALIELPATFELRRQLLEAALRPGAARPVIAAQIANGHWPIQPELFPWLERLAEHPDPQLRAHAGGMLRGISPRDPRVDRLLERMRQDQVSVVRESARPSEAAERTVP